MSVIHVSNTDFQREVLENKELVVVDFYADWCGPCQTMAPVLENLAQEHKNSKVKFVKVNVDENQELAGRYGVFSIPTLIFFKDGKIISQTVGAMEKEKLEEEIKKQTAD